MQKKVLLTSFIFVFIVSSISFISSIDFSTNNIGSSINNVYIINGTENLSSLDHNLLGNLQGSAPYFHISNLWYNELNSDIFNWITSTEGNNLYYPKNSNPLGYYNITTLPNLNSTGLIIDWNSTGYIKDWNSTGLIQNWTVDTATFYLTSNPFGFYNSTTIPAYLLTETDPLWTANQSSYSTKIVADTLYYPISNPYSYYNSTSLPSLPETDPHWTGNYTTYLTLFNWNKTYADSLYYPSNNPYSFYNSSNPPPIVNDSYYLASNPFSFYNSTTLPNLNSTGLIIDWNSTGYIKDWNATGLIQNWSIDTSSFLTVETDPHWTGNFSTYLTLFNWNKTYADTLYAPINYGDNWNKTYADTLYYGLNNPYGYYNSTNPSPVVNSSYYLASNPMNYINSTYNVTYDLTSKDVTANRSSWASTYNSTYDALNSTGLIKDWNATGFITNQSQDLSGYYLKTNPFGFYNSTNFVITDYYLKSNPNAYYNSSTAPIYMNDTFSGNYSTYLTLFNWNKTYADALYYGLSNPNSYYNATTAPIYKNDTFSGNYSTYLGLFNWNKTYADSLYKALAVETWNSTYSGFNKTYADTLYSWNSTGLIKDWNSTGYIKDWNSSGFITNQSQDLSGYYLKTNPFGFYNSTNFVITDYYLKSNPNAYYNSTTAPIYMNDTFSGNYSTYLTLFNWNKTYADALYYGLSNPNSYYNATTAPIYKNDTFAGNYTLYSKITDLVSYVGNWTLDKTSYSTTSQANGLYKAIGVETWNSTQSGFNKTYADTLYSGITEPRWTGNATLVPYLSTENTFTGNQTVEGIKFEADTTNHYINDNSTCIIIRGDTSRIEIC